LSWFLIIAAGFGAGVINALAGGGSFFTFPSLVFAGLPAVAANASSTVALVPGALSSLVGFREDLKRLNEPRLRLWFIISSAGGLLGALLLLHTSDHVFRLIVPWLLLFATLLFAFGNQISNIFRGRLHRNGAVMLILLFPISVYGGYFGGGIGIMIMAAFSLYGMDDMHMMIGTKALLSALLNAIAAVLFIGSHLIWWPQTLAMMAAAIMGGFAGPVLARRMSQKALRFVVISVGLIMTTWFFAQALRG
jgi:uncharacterized membrane protein YfcA